MTTSSTTTTSPSAPGAPGSPTRPPRRTREEICPPWCEGHNERGYQDWEDTGEDRFRDHAEPSRTVGSVMVQAVQRERGDHSMEPSIVALYVERDGDTDMTPAQAREVASLLIAAAERAEARR